MSFLNLRLSTARKAWRSFASRLRSKLRRLNKSKLIKKPRKLIKKPRNRPSPSSALRIEQRNKNSLKPSNKALRFRYHRCYLFKKKAAVAPPVYIDRLFKEAIITEVAGTSNEEKSSAVVGDDMWEALGLPSPEMNGIDQRAEEFIQRFRAEMHHQDM